MFVEGVRKFEEEGRKRGWINFTCETGIGQIIAVMLMEQFY